MNSHELRYMLSIFHKHSWAAVSAAAGLLCTFTLFYLAAKLILSVL